ncbi:MAG: methylmalonyl Co-A mutase-associated GTPase MeaB, partial [Bacteroidota bacterium]|nr:methylmalonyl Co-A mutase-associated GTPase MeaB [Bacteroidota bacterium]
MSTTIEALFDQMLQGDRVAIGKAMTLIESELPQHRIESVQLLELCEKQKKNITSSFRLAISGSPGVGKSTLIEALGSRAINDGHKVGVITVDPTSNISHGSILGDKSRMHRLSQSTSAFVRSS